MDSPLQVGKNPQIMRRRKAIIEHVFGTIKRSLGYDYFLCKGFRKVATESKPHRAGLQPEARLQPGRGAGDGPGGKLGAKRPFYRPPCDSKIHQCCQASIE